MFFALCTRKITINFCQQQKLFAPLPFAVLFGYRQWFLSETGTKAGFWYSPPAQH